MVSLCVLITLGGWLACLVVAVRAINRRIQGFEARAPGSAGMWGDVVPLGYALTFFSLWPLSLPVGLWLLRTPELARQGRLSLLWFLTLVTLAVVGLCLEVLRH